MNTAKWKSPKNSVNLQLFELSLMEKSIFSAVQNAPNNIRRKPRKALQRQLASVDEVIYEPVQQIWLLVIVLTCWRWFGTVLKEAGIEVTDKNKEKVDNVIHMYIGEQSSYGRCSADWRKSRKEIEANPKMRKELVDKLKTLAIEFSCIPTEIPFFWLLEEQQASSIAGIQGKCMKLCFLF